MFCKYKKRLSIVLCLTYILQFPFWFSLHFLGEKTEIFAWAFSVGFWGLNGFMLFLVDFFHVGLPKTGKAFVPFVLLLILSGGFFFSLEYRIYEIAVLLFFCLLLATLAMRHLWLRILEERCREEQKNLQEESVVRFSIYILPTVVSSFIFGHLTNIIPHSLLLVFICLVYSCVAFILIATTYTAWCKWMLQAKASKRLWVRILWLSICYFFILADVIVFKSSVIAFFLPFLGIAPILMHHKNDTEESPHL